MDHPEQPGVPPIEPMLTKSASTVVQSSTLPSTSAVTRSRSEGRGMETETKDGDWKLPLEAYQLAYMTSWPLIGQLAGQAQPFPIKKLNFDAERGLLERTLSNARKQIRVRHEAATTTNLREMVTMGCRALHYTGHGLQQCLAFEDGQGRMHALDAQRLQALISAGRGAQGLKFVFVSACHSEYAGNAFVDAGVPHVIAVRRDAQVADGAASLFMNQFYLALLVGQTVKQSYDIAQKAVATAPNIVRADEPKKFLLLPANGNHDVCVFDDVPPGDWKDTTADLPANNLGAPTENFIGRNVETQRIISTLDRRRIITILGEEGIGKTCLANAAARYMWERRMFEGGVFVFHMQQVKEAPHKSIAAYVAKELRAVNNSPNPFKSLTLSSSVSAVASSSSAASPASSSTSALTASASFSNTNSILNALSLLPKNVEECTTEQIANCIGDSRALVVLDGVDDLLGENQISSLDVRLFVDKLLQKCKHLKIIVTCRQRLTGIKNAVENELRLTDLSPQDAAQLFFDSAPRELALIEFGATDPATAGVVLAQHEVLQMLHGHPGNIFRAANMLSAEVTMAMLPSFIQSMDAENKMQDDAESMEEELRKKVPDESGRAFWRALGGKGYVSFEKFKQRFQTMFLTTTQRAGVPPKFRERGERGLTDHDFAVIKSKIESQTYPGYVGLSEFGTFWPWLHSFIACVQKIREHWVATDPIQVQGLISRQVTNEMLRGKPIGTFVLRFSENNSGCLAVGFVDTDNTAQHVLIKTHQRGFTIFLTDGDMTYETLPELIMKCRRLLYLSPTHDKTTVFSPDDENVPH